MRGFDGTATAGNCSGRFFNKSGVPAWSDRGECGAPPPPGSWFPGEQQIASALPVFRARVPDRFLQEFRMIGKPVHDQRGQAFLVRLFCFCLVLRCRRGWHGRPTALRLRPLIQFSVLNGLVHQGVGDGLACLGDGDDAVPRFRRRAGGGEAVEMRRTQIGNYFPSASKCYGDVHIVSGGSLGPRKFRGDPFSELAVLAAPPSRRSGRSRYGRYLRSGA